MKIDFTNSWMRKVIENEGIPLIIPILPGKYESDFDIDHSKLSEKVNRKLRYAFHTSCGELKQNDIVDNFFDNKIPVGVTIDQVKHFGATITKK